jgi:hypothetical protein
MGRSALALLVETVERAEQAQGDGEPNPGDGWREVAGMCGLPT